MIAHVNSILYQLLNTGLCINAVWISKLVMAQFENFILSRPNFNKDIYNIAKKRQVLSTFIKMKFKGVVINYCGGGGGGGGKVRRGAGKMPKNEGPKMLAFPQLWFQKISALPKTSAQKIDPPLR